MINKIMRRVLVKYNILPCEYNLIITNHLLGNSDSHLVSVFKDFLLYDDPSEFLKRYYRKKENKLKLKLLTNYYNNSSKLFPNYFLLEEGNYIYKNIRRKQKIIDLIEELKYEKKINKKIKKKNITIFNNDIYNSILAENINDRSKIKDLFGSYIFNSEKRNDSLKSIINFTNKLSLMIEQNEKENLKNNLNSINKTRTTSANSNTNGNMVKDKNKIKNKFIRNPKFNFHTRLIKYNINNSNKLRIQNNSKLKKPSFSISKEKNSKIKDKNLSLKKIPHPKKNSKEINIKKLNKKNFSTIQVEKLINVNKIINKRNNIYSMQTNNTLKYINKKNKTIEITKLKDFLNKSLRKRNMISNEFYTINVSNNSNNTLLFPETDRKKISTPKRIIKTNKNLINLDFNKSTNQSKSTSLKKRKKRKCINIIC